MHFHIKMALKLESIVCPEAYKTSPMATKSSFSVFKIYNCFKKLSPKTCFFGTSIRKAFLLHFGGILGPPKRGFSHFFHIFYLLISRHFLEGEKNWKKWPSGGPGARIDGVREPLGRDLEMGIRTSELRLMRLLMRLGKISDKFHD